MERRNFQQEYYRNNRDKMLVYFKKYKSENKEKMQDYGKKYYAEHKAKYKEMVHCEACNRSYDYSNLPKHKKTEKHIKNTSLVNPD